MLSIAHMLLLRKLVKLPAEIYPHLLGMNNPPEGGVN